MRIHILTSLFLGLILIAGCPEQADDDSAGDDDTGDDDTGDDDTGDDGVHSPYGGLTGWTDCILDDGDDEYGASGTPCTPGEDCLMVGLLRVYEVPELTDCAGVTASDALDVFEWECRDDGGSVRVVTTDLHSALHYLIDEEAVAWRPNQVIVEQDGSEVARSAEVAWYSNEIEVLPANDGGGVAVLDSEDVVYIVTGDAETDGYQIDADGIAITTEDHDLVLDGAAPPNCNELTGEDDGADLRCLVASGGQQCLWIEGNYGSGTGDVGVLLADTHASILYDLSVWEGTTGAALTYGSSHNAVVDFWIGYTAQHGLVLNEASDNRVAHALIEEVGEDAVRLETSSGNAFYSISTERTGDDGWDLTDSHDNSFDTVWAFGNDQGFRLNGSTQNRFHDVETGWCSDASYYLEQGSDGNLFVDMRGRENFSLGLLMEDSDDNTFYGVRLMATGDWGDDAWLMYDSDRTTVVDAQISSTGGAGFYMYDCVDTTVVELLAAWTEDDGFHASDGTEGLTLHQVTAVGNSEDGVELHNYKGTLGGMVSGVVSAGNYENGWNIDHTSTLRLYDVAACHNFYDGIDMEAMDDTSFHGHLWVGNNADWDCSTEYNPDPGLEHITCANTGGSDATLHTDVDLSASFGGAVISDDPVNDSDVDGAAPWDDIDDWLDFETIYRGWGPDGDFPDPDWNTGACWSGHDCRIWDWRLPTSDPALFDVHGTFVDGQDCPASAHGDVAVTDFQTSPNTYLLHAVELILDEIGDQDGLCESNEACLYVASPGAYVGDGEHAVFECTFTDGTVSGVTMYRMEQWGI